MDNHTGQTDRQTERHIDEEREVENERKAGKERRDRISDTQFPSVNSFQINNTSFPIQRKGISMGNIYIQIASLLYSQNEMV
jgi:hypothetical protein